MLVLVFIGASSRMSRETRRAMLRVSSIPLCSRPFTYGGEIGYDHIKVMSYLKLHADSVQHARKAG
jgi:hypothetical protein